MFIILLTKVEKAEENSKNDFLSKIINVTMRYTLICHNLQ